MEDRAVVSPTGPLDAVVRVPGSKSFTNRALVVAALARGRSRISGALDADDPRVVAEALRVLGAGVSWTPGETDVVVDGVDGRFPAREASLDLRDCGTGVRLLAAVATLASGPVRVDGSPRLRERPIAPLLEALRAVGATCRGDRLPVTVEPLARATAERVTVSGGGSSQFTSALLVLAAVIGLEVEVVGEAVSRPYVDLTLSVLGTFGARIETPRAGLYRLKTSPLAARDVALEGDASSAAFWLAAAAIAGGTVRVPNVPGDTRQPDAAILGHLEAMGCSVDRTHGLSAAGPARGGADLDLRDSPDLLPALAAVAATTPGRTRLRGAPHLVLKESDRIDAMATVLRSLGGRVETRPDGLDVEGCVGGLHGGIVEPRDDHRIAMAGALVGLVVPGVSVRDPGCAAKSYPGFFADLAGLGRR